VKERHGGRFHGDVLVYQSHCNRAVWLRLGHFEVSLAGQSENGYPQVIPTAKLRWTPSEDGYTETRCGRFRIEPNWYGRTRPVSYSLKRRGVRFLVVIPKPTASRARPGSSWPVPTETVGACKDRRGGWCPRCGRMTLHRCPSRHYGREILHCGRCNYVRID
jgi:hypothetical protein